MAYYWHHIDVYRERLGSPNTERTCFLIVSGNRNVSDESIVLSVYTQEYNPTFQEIFWKLTAPCDYFCLLYLYYLVIGSFIKILGENRLQFISTFQMSPRPTVTPDNRL